MDSSSHSKKLKKQKSEPILAQNDVKSALQREYYNNKYASYILPGLYLGSLIAASDEIWLKEHKITHILTVADSISPYFPGLFKYKVISIRDHPSQNISRYFEEIYDFIQRVLDQEDGNILVHCHQGVSRSASVVIAYIMRSQQLPLNDALKLVKEKRSAIRPNTGFLKQLRTFESTIFDNSDAIKDTEDTKNTEDIKIIKDTDDTEDIKIIEDTDDTKNIQDSCTDEDSSISTVEQPTIKINFE